MSVLPYYLAIGMPYELFWNGEPELVKVYQKAHEFKAQQKNQEMWVQGIYVLRAITPVMERMAQGLSGKNNGKVSEYPKEPIPITAAEQKAVKERNKKRTLKWVQDNQR